MNGEPIWIVGLGAATPVGRNAWSSAAAVRAGISGFAEHPYLVDATGDPMRVAIAPWLDVGLAAAERFEALLFPPIDEVLYLLLAGASSTPRIALSLALPEPRPGLPADLQSGLVAMIGRRYRGTIQAVAAFPEGHASGLRALQAAMGKLAEGGVDFCVVAGADTYMDTDTLEWLEQSEQLNGAGPLKNSWGFIPGEAAGAVLLARAAVASRYRLQLLATVLGVGIGREPNQNHTETVCVGRGLTDAFQTALISLPEGTQVTDIYCDMNGDPYRANEYGFSCLRTNRAFLSASDFVTPADCLGDVGAASGPLFAVLAGVAGAKGYSSGPIAFVCASSEAGLRGAAVFQTAAARR
jgi:3-oxoacyl-[acyl-carrier-protein] synthase-1